MKQKTAVRFIPEVKELILAMRENNSCLSKDRTNFLYDERLELMCPHCLNQIGFVNFLIIDGKEDICPKCLGKFTYKFNISPSHD